MEYQTADGRVDVELGAQAWVKLVESWLIDLIYCHLGQGVATTSKNKCTILESTNILDLAQRYDSVKGNEEQWPSMAKCQEDGAGSALGWEVEQLGKKRRLLRVGLPGMGRNGSVVGGDGIQGGPCSVRGQSIWKW